MDELLRIPSQLAVIWKYHFGLYTHYVGYFTPEMAKTILQIKRMIDNSWDEESTNLDVLRINEYATRHGMSVFPYTYREEINDVLPHIWKYLDEFDFSESSLSAEQWNGFMEYFDLCIARKKYI